jgi:hypothetical protein
MGEFMIDFSCARATQILVLIWAPYHSVKALQSKVHGKLKVCIPCSVKWRNIGSNAASFYLLTDA